MSRLSKLYEAMKTLRNEGLNIDDALLHQVEELEETIIRKEILPVVTQTIEPALREVQRELVLVVEYHPDAPISVALSRKVNVREALGDDIKLMEPDPPVEHADLGPTRQRTEQIAPRTGLRVTWPDGTVVCERTAALTLARTIERLGVMRVRNLGLKVSKVPLVSNTKDAKYNQTRLPNGLYVMTHSGTKDKKRLLDRIAQQLHVALRVEILQP